MTPDRTRTGTQILVSELEEAVNALPWRAKVSSADGTAIAGPTRFPSGRITAATRPIPFSLSSCTTDVRADGGVCDARMLDSDRASWLATDNARSAATTLMTAPSGTRKASVTIAVTASTVRLRRRLIRPVRPASPQRHASRAGSAARPPSPRAFGGATTGGRRPSCPRPQRLIPHRREDLSLGHDVAGL